MNTTQQNAIAEADRYAKCADLPTYSDLAKALKDLHSTRYHSHGSDERVAAQNKAMSLLARIPTSA
jgi:hypothetical protein